jgi:hypothetical protein
MAGARAIDSSHLRQVAPPDWGWTIWATLISIHTLAATRGDVVTQMSRCDVWLMGVTIVIQSRRFGSLSNVACRLRVTVSDR